MQTKKKSTELHLSLKSNRGNSETRYPSFHERILANELEFEAIQAPGCLARVTRATNGVRQALL